MSDIIVFENEPYWAPELRRQFLDDADVVVRHYQDVALVPPAESDSVLVASLEARERECAELLRRVSDYFTIFVGPESGAELERPFREAGAGSFIIGYLSGEDLARRIRRVWDAQA